MEIHKIVLTVLDMDGLGAEEVKNVIENTRYPNHCIAPNVIDVQTRDVGEWSDDHPLNKYDTAPAEIARLFNASGE